MHNPFTHPSGVLLLGDVRKLLLTKQVFSRPDHRIIFICGGSTNPRSKSIRLKFLNFAERHLQQYRFLLAENASKDLIESSSEPQFLNLTDFESLIADISDCVIIVPESPGSYTELGCFSMVGEARKKILIITKTEFQNESFINNGPIDLIDRESAFRKTILLPSINDKGFKLVKHRLEAKLTYKSGKRIDLSSLRTPSLRIILYISYELIRIFRLLTAKDVLMGVASIIPHISKSQCDHVLSILYASQYLKRSTFDRDYFAVSDNNRSFIDIRNVNVDLLMARATENINQISPELLEMLGGDFE